MANDHPSRLSALSTVCWVILVPRGSSRPMACLLRLEAATTCRQVVRRERVVGIGHRVGWVHCGSARIPCAGTLVGSRWVSRMGKGEVWMTTRTASAVSARSRGSSKATCISSRPGRSEVEGYSPYLQERHSRASPGFSLSSHALCA